MRGAFVLMIALLFTNSSWSAETSSAPAGQATAAAPQSTPLTPSAVPPIATLPPPAEDTLEVRLLKVEVAALKDFRQDFITIVLWALGIAGAMGIAVPALAALYNARRVDREAAAIKDALEKTIKAEVTTTLTIATANLNDLSAKLVADAAAARDALAKENADALKAAAASSAATIKAIDDKVKTYRTRSRSDIREVHWKALRLEALRWKDRTVWPNVARTAVEMALIGLDEGVEWWVNDAVDLISEACSHEKPKPSDMSDFQPLLDRLKTTAGFELSHAALKKTLGLTS